MSEIRQARWVGPLLDVGAVLMMASAAIYQRRAGPTYPLRGEIVAGSGSYGLVRSQETTAETRVAPPKPWDGASATLP